MPANSELVSVVIANYNRCKDLREALCSVQQQNYSAYEIIVVDNASTDDSRGMLTKEFPAVHLVALAENRGMAGYTVGFEAAQGQFVFLMDNDSLMASGTLLRETLARFAARPELDVVATRVEEYRWGDVVEDLRARDPRCGPLYTGGFHSGGVMFRREVLQNVGGYNRAVFLYGSELFLQMRILAAGYTIAFYPEILMLHKSSGVARSSRGLYFELRNRYWFMRCFGTREQQWRYLPPMLIHDMIYAMGRRKLTALIHAWHDGLGALPPSLIPLHSTNPAFVSKVDEIGSQYNLDSLQRRVRANFEGRSARG